MTEKSLKELNIKPLPDRKFFPSPAAWEDQVFYFMMLDRFSDGRENGYKDIDNKTASGGTTSLFRPEDAGNAIRTPGDAAKWRDAGARWAGGNLKGLESKIGYLKRLGVTAIWVSPVFKQISFQETYHGYGIQNFLDIDPHFGTRDDLKAMVRTAHEHGIYVIMDIILNHSGNVFGYDPDRHRTWNAEKGEWFLDPRWDGSTYKVKGFHDKYGSAVMPFQPVDLSRRPDAWPDGAIWPCEFQEQSFYSQKGRISNWDHDPEFLEGDFCDLKDISLGKGGIDEYRPSRALLDLCRVYRFWIAHADIDGFRVDTVKHMDAGATRFFASVIHEFAQVIGKENFYLIGEITGGRSRAVNTLEATGLDAALGIDDIPDKLEYMVKGYRNPQEYFDLFRNSLLIQKESHVWFRDRVVTVLDDHDQVRKGEFKARFCAGSPDWNKLVLNALALNATTLGIPCIYYGTEQCFDGEGGNDRYIREAMFGGEFGAFRSRGRHFFDEDVPVYRELSKILSVRKKSPVLRRGRQYLREISGDGRNFGLPRMMGGEMRSLVPWSRIFNDEEALCAINTDCRASRSAWVTIDSGLHDEGDMMKCIYSTDPAQIGAETQVRTVFGGRKAVLMTVPPAGFVIIAQREKD